MSLKSDKDLERERYEGRAKGILVGRTPDEDFGLDKLPPSIRAPYSYFQACIESSISDDGARILEIGAGTGRFTELLLITGARVTATDISEPSLQILNDRLSQYDRLITQVADMENLPFEDSAFDFVFSAGSLSYGDNKQVMNEIYRVLEAGGRFVCVDSLNHNPFYRLNRWIQYRRGRRSKSTLVRMPTVSLIDTYAERFGSIQTQYYGAMLWLSPILNMFLNANQVGRFCAWTDRVINVSNSAFKFVMVVDKVR